MRVTLHDYVSDPSLTQKDGVNLAHENIADLLRSTTPEDMEVEFHDFNRLLSDERYARQLLSRTDCVVSNIGPHAHFYFHLRQIHGLDFRIIRDVRTAIWSSYLHQEHLLSPYLESRDVLMVASHFTRAIYEKMFPHLRDFCTVVCYPLTVAFPDELPKHNPVEKPDRDRFTLGYIGRLSEDKNFPDIVDLIIRLNQSQETSYRLIACGDIHSDSCHPDIIRRRIEAELGEGAFFEHIPPRKNSEIWELYGLFDAVVFPSTSNLETLGRVLIEASYVGVPVVCSDHAAATELMPPSSLCRVEYTSNKRFFTHSDQPLGRINVSDMARAITGDTLISPDCHAEYDSHRSKFFHALRHGSEIDLFRTAGTALSESQKSFIERIDIELPAPISRADADVMILDLIPWFLGLQAKGSEERRRLLEKLLMFSQHRERTKKFIGKTGATNCDFTDVGGIDIELCHITGFNPHFHIKAPPTSSCSKAVAG